MIDVWNKKIPRADRDLKKNDVVCELHFHSDDVIKIKKYEDEKGNDIIYPLSKPILKSNAIPSIFPNLPSYLSTTNLKKRKPRVQRKSPIKKNKTYNSSIVSLPYLKIYKYIFFMISLIINFINRV